MSKKTGIIILGIIGVLLLTGGLIISATAIKEAAIDKNKETKQEQVKEDEYIPDIDVNESEKLKEQHCIENICIDTLSVVTDNDQKISVVSGELKNTSAQVIPEGYIKIIFKVGEETFEKMLYHDVIQPNGINVLEWQHHNEKLTEAPDYQLVKPTEAEILAENKKQAELQTKES